MSKLAQAYSVGDEVELIAPLEYDGIQVPAGSKGTVEAYYKASQVLDVSFEGISFPSYEQGVTTLNSAPVPSDMIKGEEVTPEDIQKDNKDVVMSMLSEFIRQGHQDKERFIREASRELRIAEFEVEDILHS